MKNKSVESGDPGSYNLIQFKCTLRSRYAALKAYQLVKSNQDFSELISHIQCVAADSQAAQIELQDKSGKRWYELDDPANVILTFVPENEERVKAVLLKNAREFMNLDEKSPITLNYIRSEVSLVVVSE